MRPGIFDHIIKIVRNHQFNAVVNQVHSLQNKKASNKTVDVVDLEKPV